MSAPSWYKRPIGPGATGPDAKVALRKLGLDPDQPFGELATVRVKGVARSLGIFDHDGTVDEGIARALGEAATVEAGLLPEWFALRPGDTGSLVRRAADLLGLSSRDLYDEEVENAVRRLQSAGRVIPTGIIDPETALLLGEG